MNADEVAIEAFKEAVTSGTSGAGQATHGGSGLDEDDEDEEEKDCGEPHEHEEEGGEEAPYTITDEELREKASSALSTVAKEVWQGPKEGPQGGIYWLNTYTGEKRYQEEKPEDMGGAEDIPHAPDPEEQGGGEREEDPLADIAIETEMDAEDIGRGRTSLTKEAARQLKEEITEKAGEWGVGELETITNEWKSSSYTPRAQKRERSYKRALDIEEDYRNGELGDHEPEDEMVEAAKHYAAASREYMREVYGDEFSLHRGISKDSYYDALAGVGSGEGVDATVNAMDNFSTSEDLAASFAKQRKGTIVEVDATPEDVAVATDMVHDVGGLHEGEVGLRGDRLDIDAGDVRALPGERSKELDATLADVVEDPAEAFEHETYYVSRFTEAMSKALRDTENDENIVALIKAVVDGLEASDDSGMQRHAQYLREEIPRHMREES